MGDRKNGSDVQTHEGESGIMDFVRQVWMPSDLGGGSSGNAPARDHPLLPILELTQGISGGSINGRADVIAMKGDAQVGGSPISTDLNARFNEAVQPIREYLDGKRQLDEAEQKRCYDKAREILLPEVNRISRVLGLPPVAPEKLSFVDLKDGSSAGFNGENGDIRVNINNRNPLTALDHELQHKSRALKLIAAMQADPNGVRLAIVDACAEDAAKPGIRLAKGGRIAESRMPIADEALAKEFRALVKEQAEVALCQDGLLSWDAMRTDSPEPSAALKREFGGEEKLWAEVLAEAQHTRLVVISNSRSAEHYDPTSREYIEKSADEFDKRISEARPTIKDAPDVKALVLGLGPDTVGRFRDSRGPVGGEYYFSPDEIASRKHQAAAEAKRLNDAMSAGKESSVQYQPDFVKAVRALKQSTCEQQMVQAYQKGDMEEAKFFAEKVFKGFCEQRNTEGFGAIQYMLDRELISHSDVSRSVFGSTDLDSVRSRQHAQALEGTAVDVKLGAVTGDNLEAGRLVVAGEEHLKPGDKEYLLKKPVTVDKGTDCESKILSIVERNGTLYTKYINTQDGRVIFDDCYGESLWNAIEEQTGKKDIDVPQRVRILSDHLEGIQASEHSKIDLPGDQKVFDPTPVKTPVDEKIDDLVRRYIGSVDGLHRIATGVEIYQTMMDEARKIAVENGFPESVIRSGDPSRMHVPGQFYPEIRNDTSGLEMMWDMNGACLGSCTEKRITINLASESPSAVLRHELEHQFRIVDREALSQLYPAQFDKEIRDSVLRNIGTGKERVDAFYFDPRPGQFMSRESRRLKLGAESTEALKGLFLEYIRQNPNIESRYVSDADYRTKLHQIRDLDQFLNQNANKKNVETLLKELGLDGMKKISLELGRELQHLMTTKRFTLMESGNLRDIAELGEAIEARKHHFEKLSPSARKAAVNDLCAHESDHTTGRFNSTAYFFRSQDELRARQKELLYQLEGIKKRFAPDIDKAVARDRLQFEGKELIESLQMEKRLERIVKGLETWRGSGTLAEKSEGWTQARRAAESIVRDLAKNHEPKDFGAYSELDLHFSLEAQIVVRYLMSEANLLSVHDVQKIVDGLPNAEEVESLAKQSATSETFVGKLAKHPLAIGRSIWQALTGRNNADNAEGTQLAGERQKATSKPTGPSAEQLHAVPEHLRTAESIRRFYDRLLKTAHDLGGCSSVQKAGGLRAIAIRHLSEQGVDTARLDRVYLGFSPDAKDLQVQYFVLRDKQTKALLKKDGEFFLGNERVDEAQVLKKIVLPDALLRGDPADLSRQLCAVFIEHAATDTPGIARRELVQKYVDSSLSGHNPSPEMTRAREKSGGLESASTPAPARRRHEIVIDERGVGRPGKPTAFEEVWRQHLEKLEEHIKAQKNKGMANEKLRGLEQELILEMQFYGRLTSKEPAVRTAALRVAEARVRQTIGEAKGAESHGGRGRVGAALGTLSGGSMVLAEVLRVLMGE